MSAKKLHKWAPVRLTATFPHMQTAEILLVDIYDSVGFGSCCCQKLRGSVTVTPNETVDEEVRSLSCTELLLPRTDSPEPSVCLRTGISFCEPAEGLCRSRNVHHEAENKRTCCRASSPPATELLDGLWAHGWWKKRAHTQRCHTREGLYLGKGTLPSSSTETFPAATRTETSEEVTWLWWKGHVLMLIISQQSWRWKIQHTVSTKAADWVRGKKERNKAQLLGLVVAEDQPFYWNHVRRQRWVQNLKPECWPVRRPSTFELHAVIFFTSSSHTYSPSSWWSSCINFTWTNSPSTPGAQTCMQSDKLCFALITLQLRC